MIGRLAVASLLITAPAFAQSRVYTNADLGKPRTWAHTATAEDLVSLAKRQFVAPPMFPAGPTVLTIAGDPSHGPFGRLEITPAQPLDPNWQNNAWYGPGVIGGGWYGSYPAFDRRAGRMKDGSGARPNYRPGHAPRIPPPGQGRRPAPPSNAAPGGQPSSTGNAGSVKVRALRR
jgi:hypothetical protein